MDVACSPMNNSLISIGQDGALRLYDITNSKQFYYRKFNSPGTCIEWLPTNKKNNGRVVVTGFDNGVVRFILLRENTF